MLSENGGEGQTTASASVAEGAAQRGDDNGSSGLSQSMTSLMGMLCLSLLLLLLRR